MPILRKGEKALLYIHVPKTGGSSIEDHFRDAGWEIHLLDRSGPGSLNRHRKCSPQHMEGTALEQRLQLSSFDLIFMTVREPMARFRSEVLMQAPAMQKGWTRAADEKMRKALRSLADDPYVLDNHLRPQHEFYVPTARVFRLEDGLDTLAHALRDDHEVDIPTEMPHNRVHAGKKSSATVELPQDIEGMARELYHQDFIRFGYPLAPK